jgi:hypothetical protein
MNQPQTLLHRRYFGCGPFQVGTGTVEPTEAGLRLSLPAATAKIYSDAQIDDYGSSRQFAWRPPLRLAIRARFSPGRIVGTAGFGLWNNPFTPLGGIPALPRAAWFFYAAPPSDMALALDVPGYGWKAACIDATRPAAIAWAPLAPIVILLNQAPALYRRVWPRAQKALGISEASLDVTMSDWHAYELHWQSDNVTFWVDGKQVLAGRAPRGPMGFVAWIDNQYAIVTPRGQLGWGLLAVHAPQWLELGRWTIEPVLG